MENVANLSKIWTNIGNWGWPGRLATWATFAGSGWKVWAGQAGQGRQPAPPKKHETCELFENWWYKYVQDRQKKKNPESPI